MDQRKQVCAKQIAEKFPTAFQEIGVIVPAKSTLRVPETSESARFRGHIFSNCPAQREPAASYNQTMNIVLYEPDIPWNTGNIGRTCVATGSTLHLVGRLGFSTDAKEVRRSGLDYWDKLHLVEYPTWEQFLKSHPDDAPLYFFSKKAKRSFWDAAYESNSYLIFGCETKGLPEEIFTQYPDRIFQIPMEAGSVRSLNVSTAAGVVLYEALRQQRIPVVKEL